MKKLIIFTFALMLILSGCATFNSSKLSRAKGQVSAAALMGPEVEAEYSGSSAKVILTKSQNVGQIEQFLVAYKEACEKPVEVKAAPGLIPLLSAIPKLIYDISADKKSRELDALKKSAISSYSVDFLIPKGKISDYRCLILMRHDKDLNVNAAVAYGVVVRGELLLLSPKFIWAKNTTANTKRVEEGKKEEITFMSGISLQGIGKQENGIPIIASSGQDSKKLGKFSLGDVNPQNVENGISIGPVPLIATSSISILRVSVTEVGDLGFDVDEKLAEIKTIKEAIGPALSAGVTAHLEDD